jgi:hypothetical protein
MILTTKLLHARQPLAMIGAGTALGLTAFSAFHWRAMGGHQYWKNIRQIHEPTDKLFVGGDCFELVVPQSYITNNDDPVGDLTRAFFTAPFFTLERSLIDTLLHRKWPERIANQETFEVGSKHAMWTVTERRPDAIRMVWSAGRVGGATHLAVTPIVVDDNQHVSSWTLAFGSKLNQEATPTATYLHEQYSKLLLAQTARRLQVMSFSPKKKKRTKIVDLR